MIYLFNKKKEGFTLVELLVVMSIIAIITTTVIGSLQKARSKARDQYRISSLKQLTNALEIFYSSYGRYPTDGTGNWKVSCSPASGDWITDSTVANWSTNILSSQPRDPQEAGCAVNAFPYSTALGTPAGYAYYSNTTGSVYALAARLENDGAYDIQTRCQKSIVNGATLYNGGSCGAGIGWLATTYYVDSSYK